MVGILKTQFYFLSHNSAIREIFHSHLPYNVLASNTSPSDKQRFDKINEKVPFILNVVSHNSLDTIWNETYSGV